MPDFQKYEYMRQDMYTMHLLYFREQEKVMEFFLSRKEFWPPSDSSTAALGQWLRIGELTKADRHALFDKRVAALHATIDPVEGMVETLEQYQDNLEAVAKNTVGGVDWLKEVVKTLPKDLVKSLAMQHKSS